MALLQYKCVECKNEFEELVKDPMQEVICPLCKGKGQRVYSGIMFSATGKTTKKCSGNCKTCSGCK